MAFERGLVSSVAKPGYIIIYGVKNPAKPFGWDANHLGVVEQVVVWPMPKPKSVVSIEGNTALVPGFEREGWIMDQKAVNPDRLICYMKPEPAK
jgi:hypothetical protein